MTERKRKEGRRICKCECGGEVRGVESFGRMFSWCEKCTPVVTIRPHGERAKDSQGDTLGPNDFETKK